MGQTLSEPVVDKGWRISMEDAHACILDLREESKEPGDESRPTSGKISFFGVYDGHGGERVALYAGSNVHGIVASQDAFRNGNYEQALKDGFLATDRAILSNPKYREEVSGCTASVGILTDDKIYVGNAGDSRTVLGVKGRAKPLSFDHKPQNEGEKARIIAAGGFVDFGRVNGNLALSRALGDFEFKKSADLPPEAQIVTAYPDVTIHELADDDEFMVVACDGIWDCQSSQAVVEFVRRGIAAKQELPFICENLMDNCLASNCETGGIGCDNMTVVIIGLLKGSTKEEWYQKIANRVAEGEGPCAPPAYADARGPRGQSKKEDFFDTFVTDADDGSVADGRRNGPFILPFSENEKEFREDDEENEERQGHDGTADGVVDLPDGEDAAKKDEGAAAPTSAPPADHAAAHSTDDKSTTTGQPADKASSDSSDNGPPKS